MEHVVIFVCTNTVANIVMLQLYLWQDFYNIIFKIKPKLYTVKAQGQPTPSHPQWTTVDVQLTVFIHYDLQEYYRICILPK
jgi:hypothetical protein